MVRYRSATLWLARKWSPAEFQKRFFPKSSDLKGPKLGFQNGLREQLARESRQTCLSISADPPRGSGVWDLLSDCHAVFGSNQTWSAQTWSEKTHANCMSFDLSRAAQQNTNDPSSLQGQARAVALTPNIAEIAVPRSLVWKTGTTPNNGALRGVGPLRKMRF